MVQAQLKDNLMSLKGRMHLPYPLNGIACGTVGMTFQHFRSHSNGCFIYETDEVMCRGSEESSVCALLAPDIFALVGVWLSQKSTCILSITYNDCKCLMSSSDIPTQLCWSKWLERT